MGFNSVLKGLICQTQQPYCSVPTVKKTHVLRSITIMFHFHHNMTTTQHLITRVIKQSHFFSTINCLTQQTYRVSINYFHDYKHLLQENYVEYKHIF